jgi:F-type H+-transporting ATPase subunit epsilon
MSFRLVILTPNGVKVDQDIDELIVSSKTGQLGILPNHAPLISTLEIAPMKFYSSGKVSCFALFGGVINVSKEQTTIVTSNIELSDDIDIERAKNAQIRAQERLDHKDSPDIDYERARAALLRAVTRIKVSQKDF